MRFYKESDSILQNIVYSNDGGVTDLERTYYQAFRMTMIDDGSGKLETSFQGEPIMIKDSDAVNLENFFRKIFRVYQTN